MSNTNVKDFVEACRNRQMENFKKQKQSVIDKAINEFIDKLLIFTPEMFSFNCQVKNSVSALYNKQFVYVDHINKQIYTPSSYDKYDASKSIVSDIHCYILQYFTDWLKTKGKRYFEAIIYKEITDNILSRDKLKQLLETLNYTHEYEYITNIYVSNLTRSLDSLLSNFDLTDNVTINLKPSDNA